MPFLDGFLSQLSLPFNHDGLPCEGSDVIITDALESPGSFVTSHFISVALTRGDTAIWVDLNGAGRNHMRAILKRLGVAIPPKPSLTGAQSSHFVHVQVDFPLAIHAEQRGVKLYDTGGKADGMFEPRLTLDHLSSEISAKVRRASGRAMIVMDGYSELLLGGFMVKEVFKLHRQLRHLVQKDGHLLVSSLHLDTPSFSTGIGGSQLLFSLLRGASSWWQIKSLPSGRSGDVHGEICVHHLHPEKPKLGGKSPDVAQYRLESGGIKFFPKGYSRGYL